MTTSTVPLRPQGRVHIIGAGPVGLFLAALLQGVEGQRVRLYERRSEYTRTRMVSLAKYLVADSIESYKEDEIDGQDVEALFDPVELQTRLAYRSAVAPDLRALLEEWARGFVPLNVVENRLSELIEARDTGTVERVSGTIGAEEALEKLEPGDMVVDCTGTRSLMRDLLLPGADLEAPGRNTQSFHLEHALVITFLYGQHYECNEYCKYYKNLESTGYKFIPAVNRTCYEDGITHVTGIVSISEEEFEAMPPRFDGDWLREHYPQVAVSMDNFINRVRMETNGELVGDLEITRIPLDVYHARPRAQHAGLPSRALAGDHVPLRPALRVQRVLQVLQEPREHRLQVHPGRAPNLLRGRHHPRDRHRQHQQGGVRGDAAAVRRRLAARELSSGGHVDGRFHQPDQDGDER